MSRSSNQVTDTHLFAAAMRDAKPLRKRKTAPRPASVAARRQVDPPSVEKPRSVARPAPLAPKTAVPNPGLDRSTEEKLKRGRLPIDRHLDLHGMTESAAHAALDRAVRDGWRTGIRVLLVITGKGREGEGVLRRNLPRWLAIGDNAAHVLRVTTARPQHGGNGAFYVLLRRHRENRRGDS
jgi:DNA-nicking Smr family endonuclease